MHFGAIAKGPSTKDNAISLPIRASIPSFAWMPHIVRPILLKNVRTTVIPVFASASDSEAEPSSSTPPPATAPKAPRDDDILPDSLTDALSDAAQATAFAIQNGTERCIAEILLSEFWDPVSGPVYAEEGDQQRFWKLTRRFIEGMASSIGDSIIDPQLQQQKQDGDASPPCYSIRAIYPDAGVSAMLKNQWTDAPFFFGSLNDRKPVQETDKIVVLAAPDPPSLQDVLRIEKSLAPGQALVMFNPRLASGDVGLGLNVRRLRESFLSAFVTTYSLRPVGDIGSVFRKFPGLWQVFVQDPELPGRYLLAAERPSRPAGEVLDLIIMQALGEDGVAGVGGEGGEGREVGFVDRVGLTISSLQRFMKALSQ
jgi:hypothetical protein